MKRLLTISIYLSFCLSAKPQVPDESIHKTIKEFKAEGASLSLHVDNGKYSFTYQNSMSRKLDLRAIEFSTKKGANAFVNSIGKAVSAEDGTSSVLNYPNYRIRFLTEIGDVFMIVNEKNRDQATFKITSKNYSQLKIP